jgi:hypothetical protein
MNKLFIQVSIDNVTDEVMEKLHRKNAYFPWLMSFRPKLYI